MFNIHDILRNPRIYSLSQKVLLPGTARIFPKICEPIFASSAGLVVDFGCGPKPNGILPKSGILIGFDINSDYLRRYREFPSPIPTAVFAASSYAVPIKSGSVDESRIFAVLHHFDDACAVQTIKEMRRIVKPGGRVVVFDAVWPERWFTRPLAALTLACDRGRHMRSEQQLRSVLAQGAEGPWEIQRFTYSHTGLEGIFAILRVA